MWLIPIMQAGVSSVRKEPLSKIAAAASASNTCTTLLNILARPRNMYPVAIAVKDRKELGRGSHHWSLLNIIINDVDTKRI